MNEPSYRPGTRHLAGTPPRHGKAFALVRGMRSAGVVMGLVLAASSAVLGCTAESVRRSTYPPQFRYLSKPNVENAMWKLAERSSALDSRLREGGPTDSVGRAEVVRLLTEMDQVASEIDTGGSASNHPLMSANLDQFRADLKLARSAAEQDPPNYFLAGSVAGSCLYCHGTTGVSP